MEIAWGLVVKTAKFLVVLLTLGLVMGLAGNLQAALHYRYYTTGQGPGARPQAINDHNQVAVNFNDRAYLWTLSGGLQDLGDLGGGKSEAWGINNLGQIVGESYINSTTSHAFLWQSGQMQDLGVMSGGVGSGGLSINNLGQVIGGTLYSDNSISMFQWTQASGLKPLDLQGGLAFKIIDDGRMVGSKNGHAWLWNAPGAGTDLGTLPTPYNGNAEAHDINKNGQVVGWAMQLNPPTDSASRAFSWTQSGGLKALSTFTPTSYSRAFGIDNQGNIIGQSDGGCLWTADGTMVRLEPLVVNKPAGAIIENANGRNAKGVIVGHGRDNGVPYMLVPTQANAAVLNLMLQ